jgi:RimJ/RimL family protein N-acetyltransferase
MFNFPSIRAVKKLGGELLGVDKQHFFHYRLTQGGYRYGQAGSAGAA